MYILDTDTLTHLHAGHAGVAKHLREIDDPEVAITRKTCLRSYTFCPFDQVAGAYFERFRTQGVQGRIGRADILIACICLGQRATLVTRNLRHFRQIPELRTENWVD
jgi:tRNA(fMet)-specific endonuclease VapC